MKVRPEELGSSAEQRSPKIVYAWRDSWGIKLARPFAIAGGEYEPR